MINLLALGLYLYLCAGYETFTAWKLGSPEISGFAEAEQRKYLNVRKDHYYGWPLQVIDCRMYVYKNGHWPYQPRQSGVRFFTYAIQFVPHSWGDRWEAAFCLFGDLVVAFTAFGSINVFISWYERRTKSSAIHPNQP